MWNPGELLLAAIIFTASYHKVTAGTLDMAPNAVDDLYRGCREEAMKKFISGGLLGQELSNSKAFETAWNKSTNCSETIPEVKKEHTDALMTYAKDNTGFIKTFNTAVRTLGVNVSTYENRFHFKSLHFLLMDSMMLLNQKKKCNSVYFVPEDDSTYTVDKGSKVRFGQFMTVYSTLKAAVEYDLDGLTVFNITSCFFVNLKNYICDQESEKVLLSPAEAFTVEAVNKKTDDGADYTEIVLKSSEVESSHNCYIFSRSPAEISTQWLVLVLAALSLVSLNY